MFLNALMLLGIGLAAVPWVLHLLSRSRYRNVNWGAMIFLENDDSTPRQSSRLSQFILLLLRTGVVALLAVALARPALKSTVPVPVKGQAVTAVILLDCSAGMSFEENGHSNMVLARGAAKQVLGLHKGDRVALMLMGQKQPPAERLPTADLWDVARRIESAEAGSSVIDVAKELHSAADAVEGRDESGVAASWAQGPKSFVDFYVITDRQAAAWRGVNAEFSDSLRQQLRAAGINYRLFAIPVGGSETDDVAVESIRVLNPPVIVNQPAELEITARNYGSLRWAAVPLTVSIAGPERAADRSDRGHLKILEQSINMAPQSVASFHATATLHTTGTHVISANLKAGNWPADDRFNVAVEVGEPTHVLIIAGDARTHDASQPADGSIPAGAVRQAHDFAGGASCLQLALAPFKAAHQSGADPASVDIAPTDAWAGSSVFLPDHGDTGTQPGADQAGREVKLGAYQVIVLSDVDQFTPRQAVALEQFVYDGGGVLIAPGPLSRPEDYNAALYRDGAGILPVELKDPTAADGSEKTSLSGADLAHPVFRFMAGRPDLFLSATIDRYFPAGARSTGAKDLAQYVSGDPFLIEASAGKGRVLLMTTSLGADWTSLPLSSFYLPFLQSTVRYLAETSAVHLKLNLRPGEAIEAPIDESAGAHAVTVITPDGDQRPAEIVRGGEQAIARYTETDQPGVYLMRVADPAKPYSLAFVVRTSTADSDPSPLTRQNWESLTGGLGFEKLDPVERPLDASPGADAGRQELWRWGLAGVLGLALLEMAVGRSIARKSA
jgi:hypothetical protein